MRSISPTSTFMMRPSLQSIICVCKNVAYGWACGQG